MGKHKKKVFCSKCGLKGVTSITHCNKCNNHHKKSDPCFASLSKTFAKQAETSFAISNKDHSKKSVAVKHKIPSKKLSELASKYFSSVSQQKLVAIKFYYHQEYDIFIPFSNNSMGSINWLQHVANINNMHFINPPGDGDCLFHIIAELGVLHGWDDIPSDQ